MADQQKKEFAIPLLPCNSINKILEFYSSLGFTITYRQKQPNTYAALKLREIELHFFVMKEHKPENNYSTCYLIVYDIDELYKSFTAGIKSLVGKLPVRGIPRINPLKDIPSYGVRQFIVVDPGGNYIRIGQPIPKVDSLVYPENNNDPNFAGTPMEKAYELGSRLADGKGDLHAASKVLDKALNTERGLNHDVTFKVLVLRADVANRMANQKSAINFLKKADDLRPHVNAEAIKDDQRLYEDLKVLLSDD
jgi:predicted enzyme related to lactoylglutathione lyase